MPHRLNLSNFLHCIHPLMNLIHQSSQFQATDLQKQLYHFDILGR